MEPEHDPNQQLRQNVTDAIILTKEERFQEALAIFEQALPTLGQGAIPDKRAAATAFSYFGLCVAMVNRRYKQAVEYCRVSLKSNFMDPEHHYNLARIYFERDERWRASRQLKKGLRLQPRHQRLNALHAEMGRRRPPVLPFLARSNPLNIWLGRLLRSPKDS